MSFLLSSISVLNRRAPNIAHKVSETVYFRNKKKKKNCNIAIVMLCFWQSSVSCLLFQFWKLNNKYKMNIHKKQRPPSKQRELICLPADPGGRDTVNGKNGELEVLCVAWGVAAVPPPIVGICLKGQRWRTEEAQVELDQLVDGVREGGHALLHRTPWACGRGPGEEGKGNRAEITQMSHKCG